MLRMFGDQAGDLNVLADGAAPCANSDWDGVPHGANGDAEGTMILGPQRRNRRWDRHEKARITAESFEPGANVSAVARRHGVSVGLLHYWRRMVRDQAALEPISFVPVEVDDSATARAPAGDLEIAMGGARIMLRGPVDADMLRTVFDALRLR
ncbi:transposase [Novosphingobium sp. B-7]|uniref:IS66-like element accessory protein TnpA n=1 Tax=Novosphingobium sp. B-7 TaxID=1298855 RepID=UPI00192CC10D|nr:transposase [Novosphingobium sp. B-7]